MYKLLIISFLLLFITIQTQAQNELAGNEKQKAEFKKFLSECEKYTEQIEKGKVKDSMAFPINCEEYELKWVKSHHVSPHDYFLRQGQGSPCEIWEKNQKRGFTVDRDSRYYFKTMNGRYVVIFEIWDVSLFRQNEFYYERKAK